MFKYITDIFLGIKYENKVKRASRASVPLYICEGVLTTVALIKIALSYLY